MFGAATNTNKFYIATGGPVLASGEHVTGGLMAARSLAAARGLLTAHGWVGGPRGRLNQLFTHCFLTLHQVSSVHHASVKCTHAHDAGALNGFSLEVTWCRYSTSHFSVCTTGVKRYGREVVDDFLFFCGNGHLGAIEPEP